MAQIICFYQVRPLLIFRSWTKMKVNKKWTLHKYLWEMSMASNFWLLSVMTVSVIWVIIWTKLCKVHETGEVEDAGKTRPTTGPLVHLSVTSAAVDRQSGHFSSTNLLSSSCIVSAFIYGSGDEHWHRSIWLNNYSHNSLGSLRLCLLPPWAPQLSNSASPGGNSATENSAWGTESCSRQVELQGSLVLVFYVLLNLCGPCIDFWINLFCLRSVRLHPLTFGTLPRITTLLVTKQLGGQSVKVSVEVRV